MCLCVTLTLSIKITNIKNTNNNYEILRVNVYVLHSTYTHYKTREASMSIGAAIGVIRNKALDSGQNSGSKMGSFFFFWGGAISAFHNFIK